MTTIRTTPPTAHQSQVGDPPPAAAGLIAAVVGADGPAVAAVELAGAGSVALSPVSAAVSVAASAFWSTSSPNLEKNSPESLLAVP